MIAPGINLVMTVIGFSVSTMFIVFVCTRLICARIQFLTSRRSSHLSSRSDLSILERGLRGVEPLVVSNFPTKKYSDPFFSTVEDAQCTVCLAEYHTEDTLRILPFCGHFFHTTCIDIWLQQHCTCPVCRISLCEVPEKKHVMMQPMYSLAVRSQYGAESLDASSRQYVSIRYGFSSRAHDDNCRVDTNREDQVRSGDSGPEAGESNSSLNESSVMTKVSGIKDVESPSVN